MPRVFLLNTMDMVNAAPESRPWNRSGHPLPHFCGVPILIACLTALVVLALWSVDEDQCSGYISRFCANTIWDEEFIPLDKEKRVYFLIIRKSSQIGACQFLFNAPDFPRKFKQAYAFKQAERSILYFKKNQTNKPPTNPFGSFLHYSPNLSLARWLYQLSPIWSAGTAVVAKANTMCFMCLWTINSGTAFHWNSM